MPIRSTPRRTQTHGPSHPGGAKATAPARPASPAVRRPPPRQARPGPQAPGHAAGSHDRILDAALTEFSAQGFAGARVDRIATAAGLNKAMLYYHFGSKARLYSTTVQRLIGQFADRLEQVAASTQPPAARLDTYIETFVTLGLAEPRIAPVMLRELAEGAAHLDHDLARHLSRLVATMARIIGEGRASGSFRDVDPLLAYLSTVWPIMVYFVSGPVRHLMQTHAGIDTSGLAPASFIRHMQDVSRRALMSDVPTDLARPAASPREHAS